MKIGIIGTGWIAGMMAKTIRDMENAQVYAVASRRQETADAFAREWGITRAYGSYEAMLDDEHVELVYIATPHSLHYENAKQCILKGKSVLCEKAFTVNAWQAEEILNLAKERKVFITEAIWTRYMPMSQKINEIIASGVIGYPMMLSANLGYPIAGIERLREPSLAGGALLDLGVYPINFASMVFGTEVENIVTSCVKMDTGVDGQNSITITFKNGRMAVLHSSMYAKTDRQGIISGEEGHLIVENINNPQRIIVIAKNFEVIAQYERPPQITGYEYQVYACIDAINNGWLESPFMPHSETLRIMNMMDDLRIEWGVSYPFDR